jgi:hypothetical protein
LPGIPQAKYRKNYDAFRIFFNLWLNRSRSLNAICPAGLAPFCRRVGKFPLSWSLFDEIKGRLSF